MKLLSSKKNENNEVELTIEITPEELDGAVNSAYLKNRKRIGVPGFRKGKAPRKIIEKMYGVAIFMNDAFDSLLPHVFEFAMNNTGFEIVGYPKVTGIDLKDKDTRAEITLCAALKPEVKLGQYKGLSAQKPSVDISEEEVIKEVDTMRKRNARLESVERPAALGDVAIINFEGFIDGSAFEGGKGENYELELGSGTFIPGFEDKLVGMEISQERDINLVFPENYKEDLAGKPVVFKVKLLEIKEKQLPDADDEFAKDISEFDTLDEYKASIRDQKRIARQKQADEVFENRLMEHIIGEMQVDVPDAMIDEYMDNTMENFARQISAYGMKPDQYMQMMGLEPDTFKEQMRINAEKQVRTSLALEEIAKAESIQITEDEIEAEYKKAAEEYKTDIETVKERVKNDVIERDIMLRKAAQIVIDSATAEITDETMTMTAIKPGSDTKE